MSFEGPFPFPVAAGGTGRATLTSHAIIVGEGTSAVGQIGPSGTAGQVLQSGGSGSDPVFSTAVYPGTTTINQILYSSAANTVTGLATLDNGVFLTSVSGVPTLLANSGTPGYVLTANASTPPSWQATAASSVSFTGDTGTPFSSSAVTIYSNQASINCGSSVSFNASTPHITLNVTDSNTNTIVGYQSGNGSISGSDNCVFGAISGQGLTSGSSNTFIGRRCGVGNSNGSTNTALGDTAYWNPANQSGNTAIGYASLQSGVFLSYNTALGYEALGGGGASYNIGIGIQAGFSYANTESSNIVISNSGVLGDQNTIRIGTQGTGSGQQTSCYIAGIEGAILAAGSPTPYLSLVDSSNGQVVSPIPFACSGASSIFGSLAVGTARQNTANYPILVTVTMAITAATGATIFVGVDSINPPMPQVVTASFSSALNQSFSFVVPSKYYARVTTSGTIAVSSITTLVTQIG